MKTIRTISAALAATILSVGAASAATLNYIGDLGGNPEFNKDLVLTPDDFDIDAIVKTPLLWKCDTSGEVDVSCKVETTSDFNGEIDGEIGDRDEDTGLQEGWFKLTDLGDKLLPHYMIIKGASDTAAVYEIVGDLTEMTLFSNSDLGEAGKSGKSPGISNISFWNTGTTYIPLPAAAWLLLGGLGGVGLARRRTS